MLWSPRIVVRNRASQRGIWALGLALLLASASQLAYSQKTPPPPPPPPVTVNGYPPPPPSPPPPFVNEKAPDYGPAPERTLTFEDKQYLRYVASRLKSMASDTEKLVTLTKELNAKIEKSGADSLTRDDLRTLAEIEKLAHSIKWKMQLAAEAGGGR